ncbi:MAG TPA: PEP-CTERM sorting domain-containing protein [Bryobacteraceae bacterium]|nr:PEP-CTERM sorting domain-containing protein [Bryobacteraceae bacterium]
MKSSYMAAAVAVGFLILSSAKADVITSLGNTASGLTSGTKYTGATILSAQSGQASPFNGACGSDASSNCSTNWTFTYTLGADEVVDGATLTLGIFDIDSAASGNQVGSFTLTGGDDLTAALNAVSETLDGGSGSPNSYYDVLSITIPSTSFAVLDGGSATFNLTLAGPGLGALGTTTYNGASLIFSTLDLQTETISSVPEPAMWYLLLAAIGGIMLFRARARKPS